MNKMELLNFGKNLSPSKTPIRDSWFGSRYTIHDSQFPSLRFANLPKSYILYSGNTTLNFNELRRYQAETQEQIDALSQFILVKIFRGKL